MTKTQVTSSALTTQLQKLYDLEAVLLAQVQKQQTATTDTTATAAQLLACLVEQNTLLGLRK